MKSIRIIIKGATREGMSAVGIRRIEGILK